MKPILLYFLTIIIFAAFSSSISLGQVNNELLKVTANDGMSDDRFGFSVAMNQGLIVVGAWQDDDNGSNSGSAYIISAETGEQIAKLLPPDGVLGDFFGYSVSISNGIIAVGAYRDDDNGRNSGSVYLFDAATGNLIRKILAEDGDIDDEFGRSVAISNGIVAVGAFRDDDNGGSSGSAYTFDAMSGLQLAKLVPSDGDFEDRFGNSIAIHNNIVVVGSYWDDDNGSTSGSAYLFDATSGTQLQKLLPLDGQHSDEFGYAVSINKSIVAVGAIGDDDNGSNSGSVYLFDIDSGKQILKLTPDELSSSSSEFGNTVSISDSIVLAGAWHESAGPLEGGAAYAFDITSGVQIAKLLASDLATDDEFGVSVCIDGRIAICGSHRDDDNGNQSGSVYIHDLKTDNQSQATYLLLTVHGQIPAEFLPTSTSTPPDWTYNASMQVNSLASAANLLRQNTPTLGTIEFDSVVFDWAQKTGEGTPLIATSRLCYLASEFFNLSPNARVAGIELGESFEAIGRQQSGRASRTASLDLRSQLNQYIDKVRDERGLSYPIFIDIITHSRGSTVTHRALDLLSHDSTSMGPIEIRVAYIDIIDPSLSEPDLARPLALAGHLLGDPEVGRVDSEFIHHLYASCSLFCKNPSCSAEEVWYFLPDELCKLHDRGLPLIDEALFKRGFPRGHQRPYLGTSYESIINNTTHSSVLDEYINSIYDIDLTNPSPADNESFGSSTAIGILFTVGLLKPLPDPVPFVSNRLKLRAPAVQQSLIIDPQFLHSATIASNAQLLLSDPTMSDLFKDGFTTAQNHLHDIGSDNFPSISPWKTLGDVTLDITNAQTPSVFFGDGAISQLIDITQDAEHWAINSQITLNDQSSYASILIISDGITLAEWHYRAVDGTPVQTPIEVDELYVWGGSGSPELIITGSEFTLDYIDILAGTACLADRNRDGLLNFFDISIFLQEYLDSNKSVDFNLDGELNFFDVSIFLQAYTTNCS